jgi:hypothetical protein
MWSIGQRACAFYKPRTENEPCTESMIKIQSVDTTKRVACPGNIQIGAEEKVEGGKAGGETRAEAYRECQDFAFPPGKNNCS